MPDFQTIEREIGELLRLSEEHLTNAERAEVQHFVNVGEYGLAVQTFSDIVVEGRKHVSSAVFSKCMELGREMDMQPEVWEKLRQFVR